MKGEMIFSYADGFTEDRPAEGIETAYDAAMTAACVGASPKIDPLRVLKLVMASTSGAPLKCFTEDRPAEGIETRIKPRSSRVIAWLHRRSTR